MTRHDDIRERYALLSPTLDERGRRMFAAKEARRLGHGGIVALAGITGLSRQCIAKGIKELDANEMFPEGRNRKPGGGRKKKSRSPALLKDLEALLEPDLQAVPEPPLRWTTKSLRQIAQELQEKGHNVCYRGVGDILHELGFSLRSNQQGNRKTLDDIECFGQFYAINDTVKDYMASGDPVFSMDTRKKKLMNANDLENDRKNQHFINYEEERNTELLPHGEVAAFAVFNIHRWWQLEGSRAYPEARRLLVTLGGSGSYISRHHIFNKKMQGLALKLRLPVTVQLLPPGTRRWNGVAHHFFSFASIDRNNALEIRYETIMCLISRTVTCRELPAIASYKWLEQKLRIVAKKKKANIVEK